MAKYLFCEVVVYFIAGIHKHAVHTVPGNDIVNILMRADHKHSLSLALSHTLSAPFLSNALRSPHPVYGDDV